MHTHTMCVRGRCHVPVTTMDSIWVGRESSTHLTPDSRKVCAAFCRDESYYLGIGVTID